MTSVSYKSMACAAPQFGISRPQQDSDTQFSDAPTDSYVPDTRSQRLSSGAKKLGLSMLITLASGIPYLLAPKKMTKLVLTKGGMIGLSAYGVGNSVLGMWGLVDLARGLMTKQGQYANQPAE